MGVVGARPPGLARLVSPLSHPILEYLTLDFTASALVLQALNAFNGISY